MREWIKPLKKEKKRCRYLYQLTGISEKVILEWEYLQTVSNAFILLQIKQEAFG